ncbi:hypothetical protein Rifp1Sym_co00120 [endosymbiont of Riftia pachyptila (vent Ph05)]|jgi:hypothetical protein|uniref:Uncharacterized protein n=1 Tax=endosymbiont of Riftia pachyptila (vent Ph05) TaxID=1048808 RepID=G2DFB7_9GAMM|nr:hypothetical protein Rifp1Sym_co00120 [endosymbiont of Riftia pachyptila (vent Ph05)]
MLAWRYTVERVGGFSSCHEAFAYLLALSESPGFVMDEIGAGEREASMISASALRVG